MDITVLVADESHIIADGTTQKLLFPADTKRLAIIGGNNRWEYETRYPPKEFYEYSGAPVIHAQVEEDGKIYVLLPGTDMPLSEIPTQPDGFPLKPKRESEP